MILDKFDSDTIFENKALNDFALVAFPTVGAMGLVYEAIKYGASPLVIVCAGALASTGIYATAIRGLKLIRNTPS
jgi:hypothetical protein